MSANTDCETGEAVADCWMALLVDGETVYSIDFKTTDEQDWELTQLSLYGDWIESLEQVTS